jgi:hypothetical protein
MNIGTIIIAILEDQVYFGVITMIVFTAILTFIVLTALSPEKKKRKAK